MSEREREKKRKRERERQRERERKREKEGKPPCCVVLTLDKIEQSVSDNLLSRQLRHLVLTTPYGMMAYEEARRKHTGRKIVGFFF